MKKLSTILPGALALLLFCSAPSASVAQKLIPKAQGSSPGQTYIDGQSTPKQAAPATQSAPAQPVASANQTTASRTSTPVILEFSDLQCPDSARYNMSLKSTIMQRYVATGRTEYQWHDFPLPVHDHAVEAAAAARCAGPAADVVRQKIMANQAQMTPARYTQYAQEAGANPQEFAECMRSGRHRDDVLRDKALGQSFGVKGTPSLVLGIMQKNGQIHPMKVVKGYDPPQQVLAEIDQWLAKINPQQKQAQQ